MKCDGCGVLTSAWSPGVGLVGGCGGAPGPSIRAAVQCALVVGLSIIREGERALTSIRRVYGARWSRWHRRRH